MQYYFREWGTMGGTIVGHFWGKMTGTMRGKWTVPLEGGKERRTWPVPLRGLNWGEAVGGTMGSMGMGKVASAT